jgi:hypothetical protein
MHVRAQRQPFGNSATARSTRLAGLASKRYVRRNGGETKASCRIYFTLYSYARRPNRQAFSVVADNLQFSTRISLDKGAC